MNTASVNLKIKYMKKHWTEKQTDEYTWGDALPGGLIFLIIMFGIIFGLNAQSKYEINDNAYWTLEDNKAVLFVKHTPEDNIPDKIDDSAALLLGGAIITADVKQENGYVILKRIKIVQNGNALTPGVQLTLKANDLFFNRKGEVNKKIQKGKRPKSIQRWSDFFIGMIKQY